MSISIQKYEIRPYITRNYMIVVEANHRESVHEMKQCESDDPNANHWEIYYHPHPTAFDRCSLQTESKELVEFLFGVLTSSDLVPPIDTAMME